jgi:hypothetical protein
MPTPVHNLNFCLHPCDKCSTLSGMPSLKVCSVLELQLHSHAVTKTAQRAGTDIAQHAATETWLGFVGSRVPEECPQQIVDLYQACLHDDPASRPTMLDVVGHLEAANLAVRESFASNSSAGTPAAAAGRSDADGGVSTPGSVPHLASSCESPSPIPRPSSAVASHQPRPTSAVAKYDQAALADVPPSPFAVASYHPRPTSAVAKYDQVALANVPPSPFAAVVHSAGAGASEPPMQPIAGHSDTSSD